MARQERLEQLEQQLRDIEARWSDSKQAQQQPQEPAAPAPAGAPAEPSASQGQKLLPRYGPWHDADAEVKRIGETAKSKSILALRQELLPRAPPTDPPWQGGAAHDEGQDAMRGSDQQPEVLIVHARTTAPEAWRDAKSCRPIGMLEASTWEAQKAAALLAMEAENRNLQETVSKLVAAQQQVQAQQHQLIGEHQWEQQQAAQRHAIQLQRMAAEHREQMLDLNLQHQKAVQEAAGKTGEQLKQLQQSAWKLFRRQQAARVQACVFYVWLRAAVQSRKLRWAQAVWTRRMLDMYFSEWCLLAANLRANREAEAAAAGQQVSRLDALGARGARQWMRRLLQAWQLWTVYRVAKSRKAARADRHWHNVLGQALLLVLAQEAKTHAQQLRHGRVKVERVKLASCFKAWVQLHRLHHLHQRHIAARTVQHWHRYTQFVRQLQRRVATLQDMWRCRLALDVLQAWHQQAVRRVRLREAEAQLSKSHRLLILGTFMRHVQARQQSAAAALQVIQSRKRRLLLSWHVTQLRLARNRRVVLAYQASRLAQTRRVVFQQWYLLAGVSARRRQAEQVTAEQAHISRLQHDLQASQHQQVAVAERSAVLQVENRKLRVEARQNLVMHAPEGFMNQELHWRSLPADPDQDPRPRQRCRHLTLLLPGLQGFVDTGSATDPTDIPSLSSTLVVFGGMGGEAWFNDVQLLTIDESAIGNVSVRWQLPLVGAQSPAGPPLPCTRDFAGCACGPNQFLIHGGFDGSQELSSIHVYSLHRLDGTAQETGRLGTSPAFSLSWRAVQPRNEPPAPRSHHSASYDRLGRTVLAFGGYSSSRGHLSELWAFSFDRMEWWQPETLGDQPAARRNHVAVILNNKLLIHGGFNGAECLADLWQLDLATWQWTQLQTKGTAPSARRGHAADIVAGRYLVVHGGYDGSKLLRDVAAFDTVHGTWSQIETAGGPDDAPTPRSLHTLTCVGHACVLLGGSGSLGPLEEVHLLENPAITAGLVQEQKLLLARRELVEVQERAVQLQAQLSSMTLERDRAMDQQQLLERRMGNLASRHNLAVQTLDELRQALEQVEQGSSTDAVVKRELQLQLAAAQRRLQRARQGGQQVAVEAEAMHVQLCEARARGAELEASLEQALSAAQAAQAMVLQLTGERQALQSQLAAASSEVEVTRRMAAALEQEHHAAAERLRLRSEREVNSLVEKMQDDAKRVVELEQQMASLQANRSVLEYEQRAADDSPAASPSKARTLRGPELAQLQARAMSAEQEVEVLRKEFAAVQQELAQTKYELARERAAQQAAARTAADAVEDKHRLEFRYQRSIEQLEQQIKTLQRAQWAQDIDATQQLVKGISTSPAVQALHHMLWQGATPPATRPSTAAPHPSPHQMQRLHSEPLPLQRGSSAIQGAFGAGALQVQMELAEGSDVVQLRSPQISLDPGLPKASVPGMPHVTELLRLRSALLLDTQPESLQLR